MGCGILQALRLFPTLLAGELSVEGLPVSPLPAKPATVTADVRPPQQRRARALPEQTREGPCVVPTRHCSPGKRKTE